MIFDSLRRRVSSGGQSEDSGFALIFVLFVTTVIMIGTATMLTETTNNIQPAKHSQDSTSALAAAESGIQDFAANLNAKCFSFSIQTCSWLSQNPTVTNPSLGASSTESWSVTSLNGGGYLSNNTTVRVVSTGKSGGVTKALTADISGKPSVLQYTYFSNYETLGKSFLDSYFPTRTIPITSQTVASALGVPVGSSVSWNGTATAPSDGYTDDVCNALYYDDPSNPASLSQYGRAHVQANRALLPVGTNFAEDGTLNQPAVAIPLTLSKSTPVTRFAPCEVTFSDGMKFTGPVYSRDALYFSNGEWNSMTGPSFTVPPGEGLPAASTGWSTSSSPPATTATPYRSVPLLGGAPVTASPINTQIVQTSPFDLSLPSTADPLATCTYSGPTRVVLSGSTATVTSPQTTAGSGPCYTSTSSGAGVVAAKVPVTTTTLNVVNGSGTSSPTFSDLALGANNDITTYSASKGDIYIQGSLTSGRLSVVAANDIIVTGDITSTKATGTDADGEPSWQSGAAIDLVATNNVRIYHPVACASGSAASGYCPNDITGLYTNARAGLVVQDDGTLRPTHPSLQYCNILNAGKIVSSGSAANSASDCTTDVTNPSPTTPDRRIDAAVFALNGSLLTDNYDRGRALGILQVNGGVYENHRGATGQQWEIPTAMSTRHNSGYKLQINFLSYRSAGLPFVPVLQNGSSTSPWQVVNVSTGGA